MPSPMIKATLAAAALSSTSNVLAQLLEAYQVKRAFAFDAPQFLRFVTLAFVTSPPNYKWQQYLEHTFPAYAPSRRAGTQGDVESQQHHRYEEKEKEKDREEMRQGGPDGSSGAERGPKLNWRNTLTKWFIDCITLGAIMNTVAFFILMGVLKGQDTVQIGHNIRTETIPLIVAGYKIWPIASIISFSCIPVERRIVFLNFVGLLWGVYISLLAARV